MEVSSNGLMVISIVLYFILLHKSRIYCIDLRHLDDIFARIGICTSRSWPTGALRVVLIKYDARFLSHLIVSI